MKEKRTRGWTIEGKSVEERRYNIRRECGWARWCDVMPRKKEREMERTDIRNIK